MKQSIEIIKNCIDKMPSGPVKNIDGKITPPSKKNLKESMEALIHHFKLFSEGFRVPWGEIYTSVQHINSRVPRFDKRRTIQKGQVGNLLLRIAAISK